jgi:hypothetical protein
MYKYKCIYIISMQAYIYRQRETYIKMYEYIHKCMKKIIIAITITKNFSMSTSVASYAFHTPF